MPAWIAHFIFPNDDGTTGALTRTLEADTEENAREEALKFAPGPEFVMSLHPQSEDQFLGGVRQKARKMVGKDIYRPEKYALGNARSEGDKDR